MYIVIEVLELLRKLISLELFRIADLNQPQALELFANELSDLDQSLVLFLLQVLEQGIPASEQQIEDRHDADRYQAQVGRVVEQAAHSAQQEADAPHAHEDRLSCELAQRFYVCH